MSLVGNLEDLGLGDILQIVSLSRKSGVLSLRRSGRGGAIVFRDGQVICAAVEGVAADLAGDLLEKGLLTSERRDDVVQLWEDSGRQHPLIELLENQGGVAREQIQGVVRERIEQVIYGLFHWAEGTFNFELKEVEEELASLAPDAAQYVLDAGLNPQYLAMEGARLFDEANAMGGFVGVPVEAEREAAPVAPSPAGETPGLDPPGRGGPDESDALGAIRTRGEAPATGAQARVIVIDDDALTLLRIQEKLAERGFDVSGASGTRQGLEQIGALEAAGKPFHLLVDLLMPRSDDAGILGGLEVLEHVRSRGDRARVILVTDYENEEARKKALAMGCDAFVRKPRKAQLSRDEDTPELLAFIDEVSPLLATWALKDQERPGAAPPAPTAEPEPAGPAPEETPEPATLADPSPPTEPITAPPHAPARPQNGAGIVNIREELAKEFDEGFFSHDLSEEPVVASRGLTILKAMTDELNDPNSNVEITLLVLRFAAELMSRAVIFVVTPDDLRGLGEFGVEIEEDNATRRVRRMRIPRGEPSILQRVIERRVVVKAPLTKKRWDRYLSDQLGGVEPQEAFAAPIVSSGRVVAVLYGDNVPEQVEIGDTESLEIFLMQAGMAMDRALLSRQLKEISRGT